MVVEKLEAKCIETQRYLTPLNVWPNEHLEIRLSNASDKDFDAQIYCIKGGQKTHTGTETTVRFFERFQECTNLAYGRYIFSATDFNAMIIHHVWPKGQLHFSSPEAETKYTYLILRLLSQTKVAENLAEYAVNKTVKGEPEGWKDHEKLPLICYQNAAAFAACRSEGFAFFMDQGTGKTPTTISVMMHHAKKKYLQTGKTYKTIIICPKNVKTNWEREIEKFSTVKGRCTIIGGDKLRRFKQLVKVSHNDPTDYYSVAILSYETVQRTWDALQFFKWDLAVADESDLIKNPRASRSKSLLDLRDNCVKRLALTGTPINNTILDLYTQLEWLGEGMSGFSSPKAFNSFYNRFIKVKDENGTRLKLIGCQNLPLLHERLAMCSFSITKAEALPDLPKRTFDIIETSMSPKQKKMYAEMAESLAVKIEHELADTDRPVQMSATIVLTQLLRLSQITSGYMTLDQIYTDEGEELIKDQIVWFDEVPKITELIALLKAKDDTQKTVIWTCWVPSIHKISAKLTENGIKHVTYFGGSTDANREKAQEDFNLDPECKVFIGNPAAGGVGMNLPGYDVNDEERFDTNADHTVFYAINWSYRQYAQAMDRNYGKNRNRVPVRCSALITRGTIDEDIARIVKDKKQTALAAQDIKDIINRLVSFNPKELDD